jgi:hypothetical protein
MTPSRTSRRTARTLAVSAALLLASTLPALAQSNATAQAVPSDRAFVTSMLQISRGQLALAQLAHRRAVGFIAASAATQTAQEWALLRARLIPIAYAEGAPVRGTLTAEQHAALFRLGRTPASRFDDAYLTDARRADSIALGRIFAEEQSGDPRVVSFATYAQPLVESYQQMTADDMKDHPGT